MFSYSSPIRRVDSAALLSETLEEVSMVGVTGVVAVGGTTTGVVVDGVEAAGVTVGVLF